MSAARAYTYPALRIVAKRPTQAAMFDMVALDTRPFVQTCLPGCGASPANKRAELSQALAVQVRLGWHAVDVGGIVGARHASPLNPFAVWVQLSFKSWRVKPRTYVLTPSAAPVSLPAMAEDMIGLVMRLRMDDMILCDEWRLELLRFGEGTPFYALYHADVLAGIVDIPVKEDYQIAKYAGLEALQWKVCLCMAVAGCTRDAMTFHEGEARTPIDVHKRDLPYLF